MKVIFLFALICFMYGCELLCLFFRFVRLIHSVLTTKYKLFENSIFLIFSFSLRIREVMMSVHAPQ